MLQQAWKGSRYVGSLLRADTEVPEPATYAMIGTGLIGAVISLRKRLNLSVAPAIYSLLRNAFLFYCPSAF
jgi:hypothetical protein